MDQTQCIVKSYVLEYVNVTCKFSSIFVLKSYLLVKNFKYVCYLVHNVDIVIFIVIHDVPLKREIQCVTVISIF